MTARDDGRTAGERDASTAGQRAVRLCGTVVFLVLLASVPVLHLCGLLAGRSGPLLVTTAQVPMPTVTRASFLDGSYTKALETHLQEDALTTWLLRGVYNDLRHRLGILQSERVLVGRDGWMFLRHSVDMPEAEIRGRLQNKARIVTDLAAEVASLGVTVLVVVAPDKERIYPEFAYQGGAMPPPRAAFYGRILATLREAGFPVIDAAAVLRAARVERPTTPLYLQRDTHWTIEGATWLATATAAVLERDFGDRLGPRIEYAPPSVHDSLCVTDLLAFCGMLTYQRVVGTDQFSAAVGGAADLMEVKRYGILHLADASLRLPDLLPDAHVAIAGSSFSAENYGSSVAYLLRRVVDDRCVARGGTWIDSLRSALDAVRSGRSRAKVILWEFVERHWYEM